MKFLYGVKSCHRCMSRQDCKLKNSKVNWSPHVKTFEAGIAKSGMPITVETKCADFVPEIGEK